MKKLFFFTAISFLFFLTPPPTSANYCFTDMKGSKTISSDCTLKTYTDGNNSNRYVSGVDDGTNSINTATLTVSSGTVTVNSNETLVAGNLDLSGGSIAIADGAKIEIGKPMWVIDADGDGYPADTTIYIQETPPTNAVRLSAIVDLDSKDCSDSDNSIGTGTTTTVYVDNDGDGYGVGDPIQIQSCGDSSSIPDGYADNNNDCYDENANAYPGSGYCSGSDRGDGSFDYNCDGNSSPCGSFCRTTHSDGWGYAGGHGCRYNQYANNYSTSYVSCGSKGTYYAKEKFSSYQSTCNSGGGFYAYGLYGGTCACR